jgi:starvation-inducible DNA-binding protein
MKVNITIRANTGITQEHLAEISQVLGHILADEYVLYTKTLNAHWNMEGRDFHAMHVFFKSLYTEIANVIDMVAERMRMLGHYAPATMKQFLELTHLTEQSREKNDSAGFINELLSDHESIIIYIRSQLSHLDTQIRDQGTSDYLTGLVQYHERIAWMLRAHMK